MQPVLAQFYGFEYSIAVKLFMVGFSGLALLAALFIRLSLIQWLLAGVLFFNCLSAPVNFEQTAYVQTWMHQLQVRRAEGHLVLGLALTMFVIATNRLHMHLVPLQGVFLLFINLYAGMLQFIHDTPVEAAQTIGFALGVVPCMLFACSSACRTYEGCVKMLRCMMLVSVVWTVCCSVQFVINPRMLLNGDRGRFLGMTGNAQNAALICAPMAYTAVWLMLNDKHKRLKLLWIGLIGINLLFLGWTGSRTGALAFLIGVAFVLYRRIGRVIIFLPVAALVTLGLSVLSDELQIGNNLERLTSSQNTREGVWGRQLSKIAESPLIGVGWKETAASESSYLASFAAYGFVMFCLMVGFMLFSMWKCAKLLLHRGRLPREQRPIVDLFIAWNAMYFGAAFFEGYMLGRSSSAQTMMFMFAGIGVWISEAMVNPSAHGIDEEHEDSDGLDTAEHDPMIAYEYSHPDEEPPRGAVPGTSG